MPGSDCKAHLLLPYYSLHDSDLVRWIIYNTNDNIYNTLTYYFINHSLVFLLNYGISTNISKPGKKLKCLRNI